MKTREILALGIVLLSCHLTNGQNLLESPIKRAPVVYITTKAAYDGKNEIPESYITIQLCGAESLQAFNSINNAEAYICVFVHYMNDYAQEAVSNNSSDLITISTTDKNGTIYEFEAKGGKMKDENAARFIQLLKSQPGPMSFKLSEIDFGLNFEKGKAPNQFDFTFELSSGNFRKGFRKS